jgi:hypothetical protein
MTRDIRGRSVEPGPIRRRLKSLLRSSGDRVGGGLSYWQAGGATRAAVKRVKRP